MGFSGRERGRPPPAPYVSPLPDPGERDAVSAFIFNPREKQDVYGRNARKLGTARLGLSRPGCWLARGLESICFFSECSEPGTRPPTAERFSGGDPLGSRGCPGALAESRALGSSPGSPPRRCLDHPQPRLPLLRPPGDSHHLSPVGSGDAGGPCLHAPRAGTRTVVRRAASRPWALAILRTLS